MAWLFSLSVECGTQKDSADAFMGHFTDFTVTLVNGTRFPCTSRVWQENGAYWVAVYPKGATRSGIRNDEDARELREVGHVLYDRLRLAPAYRYGLVGVEVDSFLRLDEIDQGIVTSDFSGLVLADAVWERLGSPDIFVPFAPGYRWRPFEQVR